MSSRTNLEAARLYLRIRMRRELVSRPELLPIVATALAAVEIEIARQQATAVSTPLLTARAVPDTVFGDYRPTTWLPANAAAPTLQATLRGLL